MLAAPSERLEEALGRLDPTHRALLELSLHREVADPALAELLRTDVDSVTRQRTDALSTVAESLGASPNDAEEALIRHWRGDPLVDEEAEPEEAEPEEPAGPAPTAPAPFVSATPERRSRRAIWLALAALAALALVAVLALSGGGDDDDDQAGNGAGAPAPAPSQQPAPKQAPEPVRLQPVAGGGAAGTARVEDGSRVVLRVSGLSAENHAVWLYSSLGEARALASFNGPRATSRFRLPDGFERFRFLDVSREPPDGNPNHSGESVLRVPTRDLAAG